MKSANLFNSLLPLDRAINYGTLSQKVEFNFRRDHKFPMSVATIIW